MKFLLTLSLILILSACSNHSDIEEAVEVTETNNPFSELLTITDSFVKSLETKKHYSYFGIDKSTTRTRDNQFQVMPSGRLLMVKYLVYADNDKYDELKLILSNHYSGDTRVKKVYINGGGTIAIDCRN